MASADDYERDLSRDLARGVELLKGLENEGERTGAQPGLMVPTACVDGPVCITSSQNSNPTQTLAGLNQDLARPEDKFVPYLERHAQVAVVPVTCTHGTTPLKISQGNHGNEDENVPSISGGLKEETSAANQKPFSHIVVEFFFTNLNANNLLLWQQNNFGPHYFTDDASFLRIYHLPACIVKCFLGQEMVTQKYLQLVQKNNLQFYPNISHEGIVTNNTPRKDGLLQVMACGLILKAGQVHGTFELMLALSKQSFTPNDYKIKASTLKLQDMPNASMPKLVDKSSMDITQLATIWLKCGACKRIVNAEETSIVPCCVNHPVCLHCLDQQSQKLLDDESSDSQITCPVEDCSSYIPESHAKSCLHPTVFKLVQRKMEQRALDAIKKMDDVHSCPFCGVSVVVHPKLKKFMCMNSNCRVTSCRYCKEAWSSGDHCLCSRNVIADENEGSGEITLPKSWISLTEYPGKPNIAVLLDPNEAEFREIVELYGQSMGKSRVKSVRRLQNRKLWQKYSLTRQHMIEEIGKSQLNEQRLFHGSSWESIKVICSEGLDWRNCGKNATAFGQGTYFAKNASYSDAYSNMYPNKSAGPSLPSTFSLGLTIPVFPSFGLPQFGQNIGVSSISNFGVTTGESNSITALPDVMVTDDVTKIFKNGYKYMFVVRVLVGRYTKGKSSYRKPPADSYGLSCHSCVNRETDPSVFVIFESSQCYCEYLIEYK